MPLKLLFSQHNACDALKQIYLITMHISKVRINLPWVTIQALGGERGASDANRNTRRNVDVKEGENELYHFIVAVS